LRSVFGGYELAHDPHGVTIQDILCAIRNAHDAEEEPESELLTKVVLPILLVAEQKFGQALGRISLDDMVQRAASRDNGAGRQESSVEATVKC
jgi:DNA-binding IscR family transcriptional regulator